jgi:hypothetical protein
MQDHGRASALTRGWHKSSASGDANCVEVRIAADGVLVRDDKDRRSPILTFTHDEWRAFLAGVRLGEFDVPTN